MTKDSLDIEAMALLSQALEQPSTEREAWVRQACEGNTELYDRIMSLLAADRDHGAIMRTGGASIESNDPPAPTQVGAYEIVGLIGQGGMGAVYEGKRVADNFEHRVAIKIVRPGALSDVLTERFERERQILAVLNHRNIAKLFDGGQMQDGAPYIVMEYVDGQPITEWAETKKLSLDDRLWLFSDLCEAVRHAHQNLIIHRDITPSNVLVDDDGVVKLIDFGIAKPQSTSDAGDTQEGASLAGLSFTPGYAAPERSKGAAPNTLSDVFSLGKILEALSSGVARNDDLDAIIRCACAGEPTERYASVDALLEDVQSFRTGHSVGARQGNAFYHIGKFVKRRALWVSLGTAAMTFLVGSLIVVTGLYRTADVNRQAADKRFGEAREMANFMLFDLYHELSPVSGNSAALQTMANRARLYLDDLSSSSRSDASLELETIKGYHRLANIEGNPISLNLGRRERAEAMLDAAEQRLVELAQDMPDDEHVLREMAKLNFSQSVYAYIAKDNSELSIEYAEKSATFYDRLIALGFAGVDDRIGRFGALQQSAKPLIWIGQSAEAVTRFSAFERELLAFEQEHPDNLEVRFQLATFYTSFAEVSSWHFYLEGSPEEDMFRVADEGVRRNESLFALDPERLRYRRSRAMAYIRRGAIMSDLRRYEQSIPDFEIARQVAINLRTEDPNSKPAQTLFSMIDSQMMSDLASLGRHTEAITIGEGFLERVRRDYLAEPKTPGYWRDYFMKLQMVGEAYLSARQYTRACDYFLESNELAQSFDDEIGISDADRKNAYDSLLIEVAACRDGTINEVKLQ